MRQNGFSLIELVMVIGLFGLISIVVTQMFLSQNRLYKTQISELTVTNDARQSLDEIGDYVRQATRVMTSYTTYTTDADTLILQVQSINSSNQLIPGTYDTILFYLSGTSLKLEVVPDVASSRAAVTRQLAGNATSLNFTYDNADLALVMKVTTQITIQDNNSVQNRNITVSSQAFLRNY